MAKYLNRLSARLARQALAESKAWVVSKKLILETDEGDVELEKVIWLIWVLLQKVI